MVTFSELFSTMAFKSDAERRRFEDMFDYYMSDLPTNFYKNQFTLEKDAPGSSYEDWVRFLKHPAFDSWKASQVAVIASTQTDQALAGGDMRDKDALNLLKARQDILREENSGQKPTIIVLPESLFYN
jgi:hypothetical protein